MSISDYIMANVVMAEKNLTLVDFIFTLFQRRKTMITVVFITGVLTAIMTFMVPKWFSAKVTLLPPSEEQMDLGISSLISSLPVGGMGLGLGLGTLSDETNLYLALLNSRTVQETVIKRFDLQSTYKTKTMQETIKILSKNITIEINEDNTLSLTVRAKTPSFCGKEDERSAKKLCTDMANFFIEKLDSVNKVVKLEKARRTRVFIEKRYLQNINDLKLAEDSLHVFQEKYGMVSLEEQTKAIISTIAEVKANLLMKEMEVGVLSLEKSPSHPELRRAQNELKQLQSQYNSLKQKSQAFTNGKANNEMLIPFGNIPTIGLEFARLFRSVKIQEMLLEFIYPQYEQAKIQEEKDTPTVQILDP
ncbi:MAG: hypothetical protein EHM72_02080, partial [Calditrichaeota bacterium]